MSRSCERIACLWIPSWPLQALLRAQPELRQQKLAVCDEKKPSGVVLGATLAARNMGVRAGHTVAQAQSLCGDLLLEPSSSDPVASIRPSASTASRLASAARVSRSCVTKTTVRLSA